MAALFLLMAFLHHAAANVALILLMGLVSGYSILQYADVRSSYPPELTGRALSLFTMAMFLGVALMQWLTGIVAAWAEGAASSPTRRSCSALPPCWPRHPRPSVFCPARRCCRPARPEPGPYTPAHVPADSASGLDGTHW
jgi:hypothetical protein